MGSIVIKLPMPPACLPTLWEQDERFREAYLNEFPGYYKTSDAGYIGTEDGYALCDGAAPTTSSTSPATGFPPAAWRKILASHDRRRRRMRGARHQGFDQGRGALRSLLVLKAGVTRSAACDGVEKDVVALWLRDKARAGQRRSSSRSPGGAAAQRPGRAKSCRLARAAPSKKIADGDAWTMPATANRGPEGAGGNSGVAEGEGCEDLIVILEAREAGHPSQASVVWC